MIHENPDGKYLIKGGGPKVWKKFRLRKEHRRLQGFIHGKRCGVTENIGLAARKRWKDKGCDREAAYLGVYYDVSEECLLDRPYRTPSAGAAGLRG